ncbi:phosphonate C-P lyase system protein PhnL [Salibacterium aidingense]|uniref:phosphonate C-P lyase system protein PhnL n=1 Tax=Salibacterium aidingense TaxID=384933 RepID=UPI0004222020|nr:ATP-binding cassette domain-containing protein [Salibacterium aidingense]
MSARIECHHVTKTFELHQKETRTLRGCEDISFTVNPGEFAGITGKSGAGKSTILKTLYRTYLPTSGHMYYRSNSTGTIDLAQASEQEILYLRKNEIGYVSQFLKIMPRVTALETVMESLLEMGYSPGEARSEGSAMLYQFDLPEYLWDTYPDTFSGGEKLKLNLAKAMVKQPALLLLDEPTASLDEHSKAYVKHMIHQLKEAGTTMIGIFHDLTFMDTVVDKKYHMKEGKLTGTEEALELNRND